MDGKVICIEWESQDSPVQSPPTPPPFLCSRCTHPIFGLYADLDVLTQLLLWDITLFLLHLDVSELPLFPTVCLNTRLSSWCLIIVTCINPHSYLPSSIELYCNIFLFRTLIADKNQFCEQRWWENVCLWDLLITELLLCAGTMYGWSISSSSYRWLCEDRCFEKHKYLFPLSSVRHIMSDKIIIAFWHKLMTYRWETFWILNQFELKNKQVGRLANHTDRRGKNTQAQT